MPERCVVPSRTEGQILTLAVLALLSFVLSALGCCGRRPMTDDILSEPQALIDKLNSWHKEELDIAECPDRYPGRDASGETHGWISRHQQELKRHGFVATWNHDTR